MGTQKSTVDYILGQITDAGSMGCRKMFGEYALYCEGKTVALVCDDQLFIKPTVAGKDFLGTVTEGKPFPGARGWFLVTGDRWDDAEWLSRLFRLTAAELPLPVKKSRSGRK